MKNINQFWDTMPSKKKWKHYRRLKVNLPPNLSNQGVELQKKQFILFTNLFQNQVEFGKYLFSSVITVINDNTSSNDENKRKKVVIIADTKNLLIQGFTSR